MKFFYDLHIHSCLSPCGDDDMTPNNIVNMAIINGLDVIALSDHNTCGNCAALLKVAADNGILALPAMELTTSEDIHVLCLFPTLERALKFEEVVRRRRILIPNDPEIFGNQYIMDSADNIIGSEQHLLINATDISVDDSFALAADHGGVAVAAHIDRDSNSLISSLGDFPDYLGFTACEIKDASKAPALRETYPLISSLIQITDSDAHYLWDISERVNYFEFAHAPCAEDIIDLLLKGENKNG